MIYDITQEVLSCKVFPGDPAPEREQILSMNKGDNCNLTRFSMCSHNGTHVDAPAHFVQDGQTIDQMPLEAFVGDCYVARKDGVVTAENAVRILEEARAAGAAERILIAGKETLTAEAAQKFAEAGLKLYGNESQTVGPEERMEEVQKIHKILLGAGMVLLEGAVLKNVPAGKYLLNAAPLNFAGSEGAPCRAWLLA